MVKAVTIEQRDNLLQSLNEHYPAAHKYLEELSPRAPHTTWSQASILSLGFRTHGLITNNQSEQGNNSRNANQMRLSHASATIEAFLKSQDGIRQLVLQACEKQLAIQDPVTKTTREQIDEMIKRCARYEVSLELSGGQYEVHCNGVDTLDQPRATMADLNNRIVKVSDDPEIPWRCPCKFHLQQ